MSVFFQSPQGERFSAKEFYKKQKKGYLKDIQGYKDVIAYIRNPLHNARLTEEMAIMFMGKHYGREMVEVGFGGTVERSECFYAGRSWCFQFHEREQKAVIKMAKVEQKASIYAYNLDVEGLKKQVKKINELLMEHMESVQSLCESGGLVRGLPCQEQEYIDVCDICLSSSQFWKRSVEYCEALFSVKNTL